MIRIPNKLDITFKNIKFFFFVTQLGACKKKCNAYVSINYGLTKFQLKYHPNTINFCTCHIDLPNLNLWFYVEIITNRRITFNATKGIFGAVKQSQLSLMDYKVFVILK